MISRKRAAYAKKSPRRLIGYVKASSSTVDYLKERQDERRAGWAEYSESRTTDDQYHLDRIDRLVAEGRKRILEELGLGGAG